MKKVVDDVRLMTKICDLYYNQNVSQQRIAGMMDLSRPTVCRLLSAAREQGVVRISISGLEEMQNWELEWKLEKKYHLHRVVIVNAAPTEEELKDALGKAASRYLESIIKDGNVVGVSMGSTLYQVVSHISQPFAKDVTFVPLIGGMGRLRTELHSNSLSEKLSRVYGGRFIPFHAPARVSNARIRNELMKEGSLKEVISLAEHMDVAIIGIGYPSEKSAIKATGYFEENEIESLREREVAGDICMQFFDVSGNTSKYQGDNDVVGVDIHKLQKVPYSIGVAGGIQKLLAIKGAIAGHYANVLITDIACAQALLEEP